GNQRSHFTNPEKTVGKQLLSSFEQKGFYLNKTKLIGTEGTRLLREKRGRETPQACRGGSRPPAESECLEWKSNPPPNYISRFGV
ncbi:hypothetical protein ABEY24_04480, partial [Peribacillus frigoritolerans]|uniref:hypothetical protein n=1 Tax=Peribacillus frigoritolerans TaxID=450367 RepID=UPI003D2CCD99